MAKSRFKSDATEAIHSAASGLYRAKLIDKKTMREYDDLCIEAAPQFDPRQSPASANPSTSARVCSRST